RLETLPHESLPAKGVGRASNGNFMLTELIVRQRAAEGSDEQLVELQNASETFAQVGDGATTKKKRNKRRKVNEPRLDADGVIDGDESTLSGWATAEEATLANHAVFETASDLAGGSITVSLIQNRGLGGHTLGHFRISATSTPRPLTALGAGLPRNVRDILPV